MPQQGKVAKNLARLSPKSLLTMLKKNAGLQPLPIAAGGEVTPCALLLCCTIVRSCKLYVLHTQVFDILVSYKLIQFCTLADVCHDLIVSA